MVIDHLELVDDVRKTEFRGDLDRKEVSAYGVTGE